MIVRVTIAVVAICIGLLIVGLSVLEILDPAAAKGADDNDPFGPPPSLFESMSVGFVGILLIASGVWVIRLQAIEIRRHKLER